MPHIDLADKTTQDNIKTNVDSINTKVGGNTDNAGTTSLFARLRQIYEHLTSNLSSARTSKIDNLDASVSSRQAQVLSQEQANRLDTTVSSRQANWGVTTTHRDRIDANISSRASQISVDNILTKVNSITNLSSLSFQTSCPNVSMTGQLQLSVTGSGYLVAINGGLRFYIRIDGGSTKEFYPNSGHNFFPVRFNSSLEIRSQSSPDSSNNVWVVLD